MINALAAGVWFGIWQASFASGVFMFFLLLLVDNIALNLRSLKK